MDYQRRFGGISRLYGEAVLERFASSRVCVVGIGGVGSWAAEALARSAIGSITLVDLDTVAESNINRQIHAMDGQLGRAKVDVMAERIRGINPTCDVATVEEFVEPGNLDLLLQGDPDYVLDCIDSYRSKAALIAHCRRRRISVVTVGGAGGRIDPLKIRAGDLSRTEQDPLLSKTRKLLRRDFGFSRNGKRRFGVPCIYSWEQPQNPMTQVAVCAVDTDRGGVTGLNCAGFGSSVAVTAGFGMAAAAHVMAKLARSAAGSAATATAVSKRS